MRQIVETERYRQNLAALTDIPRLQQAITGVRWALQHNPFAFPNVPGADHIRVAKTEQLTKTDGTTVRVRIWAEILAAEVRLQVIEAIPD